jgi:hypothetical protein
LYISDNQLSKHYLKLDMPTVNPVVDDQGNYLGSTISHHPAEATTDNSGRVKGFSNDYYEDNQGQTHHRFQDVELESDSPSAFNFLDYTDALIASTPDLKPAIEWAGNSNAFTPQEIEEYNIAVENEDLDAVNAFFDRLIPLYHEHGEALLNQEDTKSQEELEEEYEDSLDEWYVNLDSEGVIDQTLKELQNTTFTNDDISTMNAAMSQVDGIQAEVLAMGIAVGNGEISMEEAILELSQEYGDSAVTAAYFNVLNLIN